MKVKRLKKNEKKHCTNCGTELMGTEKFCPHCGNDIRVQEQKQDKKKNWKKQAFVIALSLFLLMSVVTVHFYQKEQEAKNYLAVVENEEGKYGVINAKGEYVVPCDYNKISIENDKIIVRVEEEDDEYKYGIVDKTGREILECKYSYMRVGENGIITVIENDKSKFINENGKKVIEKEYYRASPFGKKNLAAVQEKENGWNWGFINEEGEEVIPCEYESVGEFSESGLAAAAISGEDGMRWGFINEKGEEVIPFEYDDVTMFSENGLAGVAKEAGEGEDGEILYKWGFINWRNEEVIPFEYDYVYEEFNDDGVIPVGKEVEEDEGSEYVFGAIDDSGEEVIPMEYDWSLLVPKWSKESKYLRFYGYEYARKKYGVIYIDKSGTVLPFVDEESYDYGSIFGENGWAAVGIEREDSSEDNTRYTCSYINESGFEVLNLPEEIVWADAFVRIE